MNLSLNEEQLLIKSSAEKFFQDNLSFEQRNKLITSDSKLCEDLIFKSKELGWYALPFDQKFGGLGGNITDVMTLIETFGTSLHIDPYIFSLLLPGKTPSGDPTQSLLGQHEDEIIDELSDLMEEVESL